MNLNRMLNLLRDYYRGRTAAELFQDFGRLCQHPGEGATDFIFQGFELHQKVTLASNAEGRSYSASLVRETFLRSVRTVLTDPHIRTHMSPLLNPRSTKPRSDEELLREVNIASAESEETSSKHKTTAKKVTVAETAVVKTEATADMKSTIQPLMEGLASLQKQITELQNNSSRQTTTSENNTSRQTTIRGYQSRDRDRERDFRCRGCREVNSARCAHCFRSGESPG